MESEKELETQIASDDYVYGTFGIAVVFESYAPNWKYAIRTALKDVPDPKTTLSLFNYDFINLQYYNQYIFGSGFSLLQTLVDEFILARTYYGGSVPGAPNSFYVIGFNQFPIPEYSFDAFWTFLSFLITMVLLFAVSLYLLLT
jgi:hypothetical protein